MADRPPPILDPDYEVDPPTALSKTLVHDDGATWFAGVGNKKDKGGIMFISACPLEEELDRSTSSSSSLLKGGPGNIFRRTALRAGIDLDKHYYTTLCKYCLSRAKKLKPTTVDVKRCSPLLEREIARREPSIVVCMGKQVFDYFYPTKFKEAEIKGGWFTVESRDFDLFVTDSPFQAYSKPEKIESMFYDMREVADHHRYRQDPDKDIPIDYTLIQDRETFDEWIVQMDSYRTFSVDCEWAGEDYLTGDLRSVQFCWKPGQACMIQFFNENGHRFFEGEDREHLKRELDRVFNRPDVRFLGHNFCADYLWMKHWLGIDPYGRCCFDTMYGMQTVDENYDLKLERLSMRFTTLGRYDIPLAIWKKKNAKKMKDGGYGAIPTDIMFPYGCKDVDVPMRAMPKLMRLLIEDETAEYFFQTRLPFVTDGFAHMTEAGVPLNRDDVKKVRSLFAMASGMMLLQFKETIKASSDATLVKALIDYAGTDRIGEALDAYNRFRVKGDKEILKAFLGPKGFGEVFPKLQHWKDGRDFNPNSSHHKSRWLFDVKGFTPIKTTGKPAISWDKIEALPPSEQKNYAPSTDKDVLQVYGETDDDVQMLLEYLAVYQPIKNFLKQDGQGLESFIREDGCVHTSFLTTETGRPKSLRPNVLNLTSFLKDRVLGGFERVKKFLMDTYQEDTIEAAYLKFREAVGDMEFAEDFPETFEEPVPLRWCFRAPPGKCYTDADFATAEVFALAFLSNDRDLIATLTDEDPQFVYAQGPEDEDPRAVRVAYVSGVTQFTEDQWDPEIVTSLEEVEHLLLKEDGTPKRPLRDVHWEMAENRSLLNLPREKLKKKIHRDGFGKVGNFSVPYRATADLLERMVEVATGVKPEKGTGQKLIDAYGETKPVAVAFLDDLAKLPGGSGVYRSPTGVKRHFHTHAEGTVSDWKRNSIIQGLAREACNVAFQGLVADYLARAVVNLIRAFREEGLQAKVIVPLYDAIYTLHPIEERERVKKLMVKHMHTDNYMDLPGGRLRFNLDFAVTKRWSCKPTEEEKKELDSFFSTKDQ